MHRCPGVNTLIIFHKNLNILRNVTFHVHIWNQHRKCIKMNTNKPMFGHVVLKIACSLFITDLFFRLKYVVSKSINITSQPWQGYTTIIIIFPFNLYHHKSQLVVSLLITKLIVLISKNHTSNWSMMTFYKYKSQTSFLDGGDGTLYL